MTWIRRRGQQLVDRLEAAGSCARRAHPDGRRSSLLDVTDTGRQAHAASEAATLDELVLRLGPLAARDLDQLGTLLAAARAHLSAPV